MAVDVVMVGYNEFPQVRKWRYLFIVVGLWFMSFRHLALASPKKHPW